MRRAEGTAGSPLARYRSKRDFAKTREPPPRVSPPRARGNAFVIQKHDATRLHFDLRLEVDGVFKSWAITRGPSVDPADKRLAVEVEDHPLDYGGFEGPIPKGEYGGGTVQLWDRGTWSADTPGSVAAALRKGELKFTLHGERLRGGWVLVRMRDDKPGAKRHNWLLIKHQDEHSGTKRDTAALMALDESVVSKRSLRELAAPEAAGTPRKSRRRPAVSRAAIPEFVPLQLCTLVDRPPEGAQWVHEVKFDGYRMQLRVAEGEATFRTRKQLDWTAKFPELAGAAAKLPDCLLDGEVVALNSKRSPDFSLLQANLSEGRTADLVYYVFDLLADGEGMQLERPLLERKERLRKLLDKAASPKLRYVDHFSEPADSVLQSACRMELEGIVSKRLDAPYSSGRGPSWTKAKCRGGQEVVIGGWTEVDGQLRSLLAGVHRDGKLVYAGRVGTGFGQEQTRLVLPKLRAQSSTRSPFEGGARTGPAANVHWAKPRLVAEIEFAGWTLQGQLRQAAFKGLRADKRARDIVREQPTLQPRGPGVARTSPRKTRVDSPVGLSNADKVLWPRSGNESAKTKQDLLDYYLAVGEWMIPHLRGRPCSIVRAPDGITGETFFQRHAMSNLSNLVRVIRVKGDPKPYLQVDRVEALAALAQWAALELHPGNGREGEPDVPGRLVFDLDPGPGVPFTAVIDAALEIRTRLEEQGLVGFCKSSGGKGLHVVTPLARQRSLDWPRAKAWARSLCEAMAGDSPQRYVVKMSKKLREGRIFLDYLRNDRLATAVAPLSPRARPGAPVSLPLEWKDVRKGLDPAKFSFDAGERFAASGKAWRDYERSERPLRK